MRKKAILKKLGSRKRIYEILRDTNLLQPYNNYYGKEILLNPVKHFLMQRPYKSQEYNKVLQKIAQQYAKFIKKELENKRSNKIITANAEEKAEVKST